MQRRLATVIVCAQLSVPLALPSQVVRGHVAEPATGSPLRGVVVQLLDSAGRVSGQSITDARGAYQFRVTPGEFRARTLRIGFRPAHSAPVRLAAGDTILLPPLAPGSAISLDTIRIVDRNRCAAVGNAAATVAVWEQVRSALTAVQVTGSGGYGARLVAYRQQRDPRSERILEQSTAIRSGIVTRPWNSPPADSLHRMGYVVRDERNWTHYYAPDLDVLLSDEFVADHCFRLQEADDPRLIALRFEPTRERRRVADIEGTLWLDRASSELRRMEFRYVNLPEEERRARAGGEMEFAALADGAWIISQWHIRMPVVEMQHERIGGTSAGHVARIIVTQLRIEGGQVSLIHTDTDTLWRAAPLILVGAVLDSATGEPLPGTKVSVRGTGIVATADSAGSFRITELLPGSYMLDVRSEPMQALGTLYSAPVTITKSARLTIRPTPAITLARSLCRGLHGGMIAGRLDVPDSTATGRIRVVAEWRELIAPATADDGSGAVARVHWREAVVDDRGLYRLCGLPANVPLTVLSQSESGASEPLSLRLRENELMVAHLAVRPDVRRHAVLSGEVLSDVNGAPMTDVQVSLPALSRSVHTNAIGGFRMAELPPGRHELVVRRLGWKALQLEVELAANQTVERQLLMSRLPVLDTVGVPETYAMRDFEEHRSQGLGRFLTRSDVEKVEHLQLSSVVEQFRSVRILRKGLGNRAYLQSARGTYSIEGKNCRVLEGTVMKEQDCGCFARVYLDGVLLNNGLESEIIPDINAIQTTSIEAIEYYSSPDVAPLKYSTVNSLCGVLVIHTRLFDRKRRSPR